MRTIVNFINVFSRAFFVRTSFLAAFLVTFQLDAKNSYEKCTQKMLMKLTPGIVSTSKKTLFKNEIHKSAQKASFEKINLKEHWHFQPTHWSTSLCEYLSCWKLELSVHSVLSLVSLPTRGRFHQRFSRAFFHPNVFFPITFCFARKKRWWNRPKVNQVVWVFTFRGNLW